MRDIISSINNPVATAVGEASQVATAVHTSAGHSSRYVTLPDKGLQVKTVQPRSGVNFVLYNSAFEVVEENTGYLPVDDKINAIQTLSTDKMVMAEAGFIEVFVDNQANTAVYYDNMMVIHSRGSSNVLEVNAYYPFGMLMPGLSLIAPPGKYNAYKHSAKELQKELNLQWYDHGARMYDPTVSRWWLPDPLAEKAYDWSPYRYGFNNPINVIDLTGLFEGWVDTTGNNHYFWDESIDTQEKATAKYGKGAKLAEKGDWYWAANNKKVALLNNDRDWVYTGEERLDPECPTCYLNNGNTGWWEQFQSGVNSYKTLLKASEVMLTISAYLLAGTVAPEAALVMRGTRAAQAGVQGAKGSTQLTTRFVSTADGIVDASPTLNRISSGLKFPHRNDGSIFQNLAPRGQTNPLLPVKPQGYYREFVHPTPGLNGPGPMRIVTGQSGEMWFTPNHYNTFIPIR